MNIADLSIRRPIFISCIVILMLVLGLMSMKRLGVDLFPDVTFPIVTVTTLYPGAGPSEMETLVSKVIEEELSTIGGVKRIRSRSKDSLSQVIAEFTLETDVKYAEQQVRDRVSAVKRRLPNEVEESIIRRIDPADQPIVILVLSANLPQGELYDLASETIQPRIEQIDKVGLVEVLGGRKREIRVEIDRAKLRTYEISASQVSSRLAAAGLNVPAGKVEEGGKETVYRTLGEFKTLRDIEETPVNFLGNDVPVTVSQVGTVIDGLEDETSRTFYNGKQSVLLMIFRQSGANTVSVVGAIRKRVVSINEYLKTQKGAGEITIARDNSKAIEKNIDDVQETIFLGIGLTILVVFFFLGSGRSTIITGLALPNSLLGAFILMYAFGFTINVMTLLALSLAVGLLVDDAIVVRENIFRHIEMGEDPLKAASEGTREVSLAVIATTMTVLAVFGPIAFLQGVVGQFFKQFGLTICFAMCISLFDALTVAPMLSAYFAGGSHKISTKGLWGGTVGRLLLAFSRFQDWLENRYEKLLRFTLAHPFVMMAGGFLLFVGSLGAAALVPKTFLPPQDFGEFSIGLESAPGTSLGAMSETALKVDAVVRQNPEILKSILIVGNREGETNISQFFIELVPDKQRKVNTSQMKERLRAQLKDFAFVNPTVKDIDMVAGGIRPFTVNIVGSDLDQLEKAARPVYERLRTHPALKDVEYSQKPGKPEFQVALDPRRAEQLGVSSTLLGMELRSLIEGETPAVFRENGKEYDIRVRLREDQRNLKEAFKVTYVPNMNHRLIRLQDVARAVDTMGPANINRQDRGRYISIGADITPGGAGMGKVMEDIATWLNTDLKLPEGVTYGYVGQAENFAELMVSMLIAISLAVVFIYLVLASLYESFINPFTIMLVLPLAACGAFFALYITGSSLDIYSMIGCVMLLGVATKNSILLVDYANQLVAQGVDRAEAVVRSGKTRLRPILMTTFALIAGMLPVAIGLNEASKERTSMGIAVIGGLISSTVLSLVVVPACFSYIDRFRVWAGVKMKQLLAPKAIPEGSH
jgi:hydrophobic/amphiphilic exporter-1 (mainly G- bacteria), HAE1 family